MAGMWQACAWTRALHVQRARRPWPHGSAVMHFADSQSSAAKTWFETLAAKMRCCRVVAAWSRLGGGFCVALACEGALATLQRGALLQHSSQGGLCSFLGFFLHQGGLCAVL